MYADQFDIYTGNANPDLARKICRYLGVRARPGRGLRVRQREHLRQDPRQRPREGRLPRPADLPPGEPVDHGAADHDRRLQAGERRPDHGRHPVLRLRPVGQEGPAAGPDHGPPGRRHDHRGRRGPGPDDGPPPGPDPGLLQHPGRRADRRPHPVELLPPRSTSRTSSSSPTSASPSGRGPSPSSLDAPLAIIEKRRVGNLDRAELLNVIGEVRGKRAIIVDDEIDTAGTLIEVVRALEREGVNEIYACATHGVLSDPAVERIRDSTPPGGRPDRLDPAPGGEADPQDHDVLGRAAHRRGDPADPSRRVGRRAVQQRGRPHPGDAAVGGRRRAGRSTCARTRTSDRHRAPRSGPRRWLPASPAPGPGDR